MVPQRSLAGFAVQVFPAVPPPPKGEASLLRVVLSTLSHRAFLGGPAFGMHGLVRCRRWKPTIRRRSLRCALCVAKPSMSRGWRQTPLQQRLHHLGPWHAHVQRERSDLHFDQLQLDPIEAAIRKSDPSFEFWLKACGLVDKAAQIQVIHFSFTPASMASGVLGVWFHVRIGMVSVFFADTVKPAASTSMQ